MQGIYNFKHVSDKNFTVINNVEEIFVEEVNDLNEIEADNYSSSFGFPKKSNYSTPFWGKCKCELYHIPPFEPSVLIP